MLLSWLEDDVTGERTSHSNFADAIAIAACLAAALLVRYHGSEMHTALLSAAKTPHALIAHHPARIGKT